MVIDELKSLLIKQLKSVYGLTKVYDEPVQQGLVTPSFSVSVPEHLNERKLNVNSERTVYFNVVYFPASADIRTETDQVAEKFFNEFRYLGGQFHINNAEATLTDNTLSIIFHVRFRVRQIADEPIMQTLGGVNIGQSN